MNKQVIGYALVAISLFGCSNARKAELTHDNDPQMAVAEVNQIRQDALSDQIDVLADSQFEDGKKYLTRAQFSLEKGRSINSILENAAIAKAFFQDAVETAQPRKRIAGRILEARKAALKAGLRDSAPLPKELETVDGELKDQTDQFSRALTPEEFSDFQKKYLVLEIKAIQFKELGDAAAAIENATKNRAGRLAPKSLQTASLDYKDAENTIARSPRNAEQYKQSVQTALESTMMLQDVMDVIMDAKGTPEKIAIQIVTQKRKLGELTTNVGRLNANLQSTQETLQEKEGALKLTETELRNTQDVLESQEEQLARASVQVRFQQAMDEAREVVPQSDALVYQQGNTLVFRLKRINFKTGTAIIPEASKPLLSKVDTIIGKLDAETVIVEGHTDSIGPVDVNLKLSEERAIAVADYISSLGSGYPLEHVGHGDTVPIAANGTAEGRATNRRVDLVVSVKK
ncbi:OmpA family protein [Thiohalomonas denitrificans]|uniref:OmpA family protein n=1 Tax=Thiohalomonas denitrificans TaxID=415747 RepID=UPI0026F1B187|nr:OmpA family protein [Thiohalomonas denitrificans]